MATRDRSLLEQLREALGFGSIQDRKPARQGWQPTSVFSVASRKAHVAATIPFMEQFLLHSAKREQFEQWRDALLAYDVRHPNPALRGRSVCSVEGCTAYVRGRGLCRRHYYRATGY
jgi:hypothetical protein